MESCKKVALDAMGGDFGVPVTVAGAIEAAKEKGIETILVGDERVVRRELNRQKGLNLPQISIAHASEVIGSDEQAARSIRKKPNASINMAFDLLSEGRAGAVVSAGHSGATMASALTKLKRITQIERPAIAITMPTLKGYSVALDGGANVDCRPSHLVQFAVMGELFARVVQGKERPTVGLLSNGREENKGNDLTRFTNDILKSLKFNYVGYVEGRDLFTGEIDVAICDGFVGNVVLKSVEGIIEAGLQMFTDQFRKGFFSRMGMGVFYGLFRKKIKRMRRQFDYSEYGAAPLLGVNGIGLVCHGSSGARAIKNALILAHEAIDSCFIDCLRKEMGRLEAKDTENKEGKKGEHE